MTEESQSNNRRPYLKWLLLLAILIFTISISHRKGNDINVYLHAADQLWDGSDPFVSNPYNNYLYGPSFALLLKPLTLLGYPIARVIWALICMLCLYRVWHIFRHDILARSALGEKQKSWIGFVLLLLSVNVYIHNLNLGQVTLPILWCLIEGLNRIRKGDLIIGGFILAMGIDMKILPLLALYYLFLKGRIQPIIITVISLLVIMLIPAVFIGWETNLDFHIHWLDVINPVGKRFAAEINDGCISINCLLSRLPLEDGVMSLLTNILRLIVLVIMSIFYIKRRKVELTTMDHWRDWSIMLLGVLMIFPHQMKYSMLFIVPAGAYLLVRFIVQGKKWNSYYIIGAFCLVIPAIMGRDIIGNATTDFLDTIGILGILTIVLFVLLLIPSAASVKEIQQKDPIKIH
ncbi:MAG: DUF2029 domain-containing protein [Flavobacteriales bacterium]|nr:DUF2029 domain-containing protein [Flavobacteriales bacterium]